MNPLILIPSYNTGPILSRTVADALSCWPQVWVVVDGSTDGSAALLDDLKAVHPGLRVLTLPRNQGKGAAVLHGAAEAAKAGFTHVLTLDADGQHPAGEIPRFLALAEAHPQAALMGRPVFGPEAPQLRVQGRKLSNVWAHIETLGWGIPDSLFGMRLYPVEALLRAFAGTAWARRFDYDTEVAGRLARRAHARRAHPRALPHPRGGRHFPVPLPPGQCPAHLDARPLALRLPPAPAAPALAAGQRRQPPAPRPRRITRIRK